MTDSFAFEDNDQLVSVIVDAWRKFALRQDNTMYYALNLAFSVPEVKAISDRLSYLPPVLSLAQDLWIVPEMLTVEDFNSLETKQGLYCDLKIAVDFLPRDADIGVILLQEQRSMAVRMLRQIGKLMRVSLQEKVKQCQ